MSLSRPRSTTCVGSNDAPPIDEGAAPPGRSAMEGGVEPAGARRALPVRAPALVVHASSDLHIMLFATSSPATVSRLSTNAPQRPGASQHKVAMSAPV